MSSPSNIVDYSQSTGFPFYAYATEQMVSIVRAWAEHTWPITLDEAFLLRDQCGWTGAPHDGTFFTTPVSSGETDGTIMKDTRDRNLVNSINARLTTRAPVELEARVSAITQSVYTDYRNALTTVYGPPKEGRGKYGPYSDWILPSNASIHLPSLGTFVKVTIDSPTETHNAALAAYYESKYGPDLP
ncbi:DUF6301 family protein [Actinomyces sp. CCUG 33915]